MRLRKESACTTRLGASPATPPSCRPESCTRKMEKDILWRASSTKRLASHRFPWRIRLGRRPWSRWPVFWWTPCGPGPQEECLPCGSPMRRPVPSPPICWSRPRTARFQRTSTPTRKRSRKAKLFFGSCVATPATGLEKGRPSRPRFRCFRGLRNWTPENRAAAWTRRPGRGCPTMNWTRTSGPLSARRCLG